MADEPILEPATTVADEVAESTVLTEDTAADTTSTDGAPSADQEETTADTEDGGGDNAGDDTEAAPESYADFVMPEGVEVDAALLESATPLFKELGLNQEQAQKLVDFQAAQVQAGARSQVEAFNQLKDGWVEQAKSDKEFGGDKFEESVGIAQMALNKFGTPELKELMNDHGVGNHPEMIRFMVRVGALTKEDVPGGGNAPSESADRATIMYPKST